MGHQVPLVQQDILLVAVAVQVIILHLHQEELVVVEQELILVE